MLDDLIDFTRRAEHSTRSAGAKRRYTGADCISNEVSVPPAAPVVASGSAVPSASTTDPEVFRRLDRIMTAMNRLSHEVGRLATEVAILQRLSDNRDDASY